MTWSRSPPRPGRPPVNEVGRPTRNCDGLAVCRRCRRHHARHLTGAPSTPPHGRCAPPPPAEDAARPLGGIPRHARASSRPAYPSPGMRVRPPRVPNSPTARGIPPHSPGPAVSLVLGLPFSCRGVLFVSSAPWSPPRASPGSGSGGVTGTASDSERHTIFGKPTLSAPCGPWQQSMTLRYQAVT